MTDDSTCDRLREYGAATLHEAQGGTGALSSAIKPLDNAMTLAGRAVTVDVVPGDNLGIQRAAELAEPGDVLVIDAKGYVEAGTWGDVLTTYAQARGLGGLVIDGSVRDSRAIIALGFPAFSRGISIKGTRKTDLGRVNIPVVCGGVTVRPGDIVVGDADGVVVLEQERVAEVLELAQAREDKEQRFKDAFAAGKPLLEVMGLSGVVKSLEQKQR